MRFETVNLGVPGPGGAPGAPGTPGKSAYEIAVDNGFVGTEEEWLESLAGTPGPTNPSFHNTLVAAQAATLTDINAVTTAGFTAIGDGGEGVYKVQDTEPPPIGSKLHHVNIGGRWIVLAGDRINLKAMGASLLPADDQTDYLQDAINAHKPIFIPSGTVKLTQSVTYDTYLYIEGIGAQYVIPSGIPGVDPHTPSTIIGELPKPLIYRTGALVTDNYPAAPTYENFNAGTGSRFAIRHITLSNHNEAGSCIQVYNSVCPIPIEHVMFLFRYRGAELIQPFSATVVDCGFYSDWIAHHNVLTEDYHAAVGLIAIQTKVFNCEATSCGTGARLYGAASIYGGRFEVNGLGIHAGARSLSYGTAPGNVSLSCSTIENITFEANHNAIEVVGMNASRIANLSMYSSANGPATRPDPYDGYGDTGLTVLNGDSGCIIEGIGMNGSFMKYAYDIRPQYEGQMRGIIASNVVVPTTSVVRPTGIHRTNMMSRDINATKGLRGIFDVDIHDKVTAPVVNSDRYASHMGNLRISALVQPDFTKPPVYGRNLAGTLAVADGANTATLTFLAGAGEGTAQFNGAITAVAQPGSSLAAGTYYYATTLLGPRGETGVTGPFSTVPAVGANYKSVVIAVDQKASIALFPASASLKRRIYRGRQLGLFDGFWEMVGTTTAFTDDGTQAFDGYSYPPTASNVVPSHVEPDTSYYVQVQPTWATTWYVSAKSTSAFTITFGTANSTGTTQTVGWLMYRP